MMTVVERDDESAASSSGGYIAMIVFMSITFVVLAALAVFLLLYSYGKLPRKIFPLGSRSQRKRSSRRRHRSQRPKHVSPPTTDAHIGKREKNRKTKTRTKTRTRSNHKHTNEHTRRHHHHRKPSQPYESGYMYIQA